MRRGQESPWLEFMENKGRSLIEWSENHPAGQSQCGDKLGMLTEDEQGIRWLEGIIGILNKYRNIKNSRQIILLSGPQLETNLITAPFQKKDDSFRHEL
jgi:hypothetical protein